MGGLKVCPRCRRKCGVMIDKRKREEYYVCMKCGFKWIEYDLKPQKRLDKLKKAGAVLLTVAGVVGRLLSMR